jgi:tetratricopeptide (TPR) repeat protein
MKAIPMFRLKRILVALFCAALMSPGQPGARQPEGTSLLGAPLHSQPDSEGRIAKADAELKKTPVTAEAILAAGKARDAASQYAASIDTYTKGIMNFPADPRFYRMRGHRYISLRKFPEAIKDLERVRALAPSSFEGAYYLGLAQYFNGGYNEAAEEFARCVNMAGRPDPHAAKLPKGMPSCAALHQNLEFLVGMADWHWRALRRGGRVDEARDVLKGIPAGAQVRESISSYRLLMYHKGVMKEAEVLEGLKAGPYSGAASGLGLAHLLNKKTPAACDLWRKAAAEPWQNFGVIAAEVELARTSKAACALFK